MLGFGVYFADLVLLEICQCQACWAVVLHLAVFMNFETRSYSVAQAVFEPLSLQCEGMNSLV